MSFSNMKIKKLLVLLLCTMLPLIIGSISGWATRQNIESWYIFLHKPSFNPPNFLFAPVWTMLYFLMGISLYLISTSQPSHYKKKALMLFGIQLLLNFGWSFIFFYFHQIGWAFIEIIILWLAILAMIILFYKINKTAAYLQLPYLGWLSFATVLNASIGILN